MWPLRLCENWIRVCNSVLRAVTCCSGSYFISLHDDMGWNLHEHDHLLIVNLVKFALNFLRKRAFCVDICYRL